jgi:putative transposase
LATYYVLFFLHLESRRGSVEGITRHPDQEWMEQIARSATQETWVYRDTKFGASLRSVLAAGDVKSLALPTRAG